MIGLYAVYQKQDGALCALSTNEAANPCLVKVSLSFRSYGRALVAKQELERLVSDGDVDA